MRRLALLGAVLHKLTGRPFDTLEHDVLLDPPGISDVACDKAGRSSIVYH